MNSDDFNEFLYEFIQKRFEGKTPDEIITDFLDDLSADQFEALMFHDFLIEKLTRELIAALEGDKTAKKLIVLMFKAWMHRAKFHRMEQKNRPSTVSVGLN